MVYDLCIVGAGMFGSAAARHASENGNLKICLIGPSEPSKEKKKEMKVFACHYDEGRITRTLDEDPDCQILAKCSINRYRELENLSGIKFYNPVGTLLILHKNCSYLQKTLKAAKDNNIPLIQLSCKEEFNKKYPYLRLKEDEIALVDNNGGGHISPRKIVKAQKKVAKQQGCDIYDNVVSQIRLLDNGLYQIEIEQDAKETKMMPHPIISKKILVTNGSFVNAMKFSVLRPLNVKTYKKTVTLVKIPEDEVKRLSSMPSIIYRGRTENPPPEEISAYLLPPIKYPDGNYYLKIGYYGNNVEIEKLQDIKDWYLSDGDTELITLGSKLLAEMLPGLKYDFVTSDTCVMCYTPTGLPYIDQINTTLAIATAGNGKGAKFSDEVGRLAAELSLSSTWNSNLPKSHFKAIYL